ncbi:hypothetical protein PHMEG_00010019 [Phytophthora megakarya]|uniref:Integrase catalytic domain-containing protein n=1 Tax=Phytophthora megakarya TaxID=4795 RepID=A0A225WGS7_9STRA|nr:hypothetical protein PHMEG_00010019 [Phytophthora megakarya]
MAPDRLGHNHSLIIVDHAINYNSVYLLRKNSEVEVHSEDLVSEYERQYETNVKVIRSDGGGEFGSNGLDRFILNRGIRHLLTERDMSSSKGKAERFHRTVMDSERAMLWAPAFPLRFGGGAPYFMRAIYATTYRHEPMQITHLLSKFLRVRCLISLTYYDLEQNVRVISHTQPENQLGNETKNML